jgi:DNA-binding MarR family transcriptional regulator
MVDKRAASGDSPPPSLGPLLRRAWLGYQERIDEAVRLAGFDRRYPDARVLRRCSHGDAMTISDLGRELGVTRQAAAKLVARLAEQGYVAATQSPTDRREKLITLTAQAEALLAAITTARRDVDEELRQTLGDGTVRSVQRLARTLTPKDRSRQHELWRRVQLAALDADDR